jgi:hypothetical protein
MDSCKAGPVERAFAKSSVEHDDTILRDRTVNG